MTHTTTSEKKLSLHIPSNPGAGSKVKSVVFSEKGHVVYQIKGNDAHNNMQAKVCIYTHTRPLGWVQ